MQRLIVCLRSLRREGAALCRADDVDRHLDRDLADAGLLLHVMVGEQSDGRSGPRLEGVP